MGTEKNFYTVRGYEIIGKDKKILTSSMEDYLEMIYRNSLEDGYTRINNLSECLNVQAPSATKMVQKLSKHGLVDYEKYGVIKLTDKGKNMGQFLLNRHNTIETFFKLIGLNENILINIELIEHNITIDALSKIEILNSFFEFNPEIVKNLENFRLEKDS